IAGRTIRVDHVQNYKVPKVFDADGNEVEPDEETVNNAAPKPIQEEDSEDDDSSESEVDDTGIDIDDPMREYLLKKRKKEARKAKRKAEKEAAGGKSESKAEKKARKEAKKAAKREKGQDKDGGNRKASKRSSKDKESSPSPSTMRDDNDKRGEAMEVDVKKDGFADKIPKDSSVIVTDRNTSSKETTVRSSPPPPPSSSLQRRPRSRSRSPRPRQRSNHRHHGRSQSRSPSPSREKYRDSRDDYSRNSRRRGDSWDRGGGYNDRDSRGSRYKSRSRTPPRRGGRRSRTRSPE
ncbi:hypothetical protein BGZ95_004278, partial [Linnemannia exigua]